MTAPESAPEIQAEIEKTREHLGQTVEELAAKADVKARAQAKAAELRATAQGKAAELRATAQGKAAGLKSAAQGKSVEVRSKATELSGQLRRSDLVQRRWPLAVAAAGVLAAGSLVIWRWRKA
ncbi:MAG: DUF3618 domain-containing protein [Actinobacteria bacterium]|nr:DUF3618 domain-containing protein [Actinomycetota bacterium]